MEDFLKEFYYDKEQLQAVCRFFCRQLNQGLASSSNDAADIKCYVTYVQDLPTGQEDGKVLVLDLSDMNFRVLLVTLKGNREADIDSETFVLTDELMHCRETKLFSYIAKCLSTFIHVRFLESTLFPLAFIFSFPTIYNALDEAILVKWTRGFKCSGVIDREVVGLLKNAIARQGDIKINVVAVLSDAIGALMSCAYSNPNCRIGLIVGTGCNAAYMEQTTKAELLEDKYRARNKMVAINLEWGSFGQNGCLNFIRTDYDRDIDGRSWNKGEQIFEKMISGMYLGEIFRLVMLKAIKLNLMFKRPSLQYIPERLSRKNIFLSSHVSQIEADCLPDYKSTRQIFREVLSMKNLCDDDIQCVRKICEAVTQRSATLVGVTISVLINRVNMDNVVVGIDGSIIRSNRKYITYMRKAMRRMVNPRLSYELMLSEDGPARGGALVYASRKLPKPTIPICDKVLP